jgi:hypothetical protein
MAALTRAVEPSAERVTSRANPASAVASEAEICVQKEKSSLCARAASPEARLTSARIRIDKAHGFLILSSSEKLKEPAGPRQLSLRKLWTLLCYLSIDRSVKRM